MIMTDGRTDGRTDGDGDDDGDGQRENGMEVGRTLEEGRKEESKEGRKEERRKQDPECIFTPPYFHSFTATAQTPLLCRGTFKLCKVGEKLRKEETNERERRRSPLECRALRSSKIATKSCAAPKA